jgi:hypothetical protein
MMKSVTKEMNNTGKIVKRTRGYRLKPSTHALIVKIQEILQSDQDEAIAGACSMYYAELQRNARAK